MKGTKGEHMNILHSAPHAEQTEQQILCDAHLAEALRDEPLRDGERVEATDDDLSCEACCPSYGSPPYDAATATGMYDHW